MRRLGNCSRTNFYPAVGEARCLFCRCVRVIFAAAEQRTETAQFPFRRGVAQSGSAPVWGAGGRRFKSSRPDQLSLSVLKYTGHSLARAFRESAGGRRPRRRRSNPLVSTNNFENLARHRKVRALFFWRIGFLVTVGQPLGHCFARFSNIPSEGNASTTLLKAFRPIRSKSFSSLFLWRCSATDWAFNFDLVGRAKSIDCLTLGLRPELVQASQSWCRL